MRRSSLFLPLLFLCVAQACTGTEPVITPSTDAGAGGEAAAGEAGSDAGTDAIVDAPVDGFVAPGQRRACPAANGVVQTASDRVVFEPRGLIVDETGRLVAWEESRTKKRAVPENPSAGTSKVVDCCASFGVGGGLTFASIPELDVAANAQFAVHARVRRTTSGASTTGGGAMIVKKPTAAFPFTGFATTVAGRDPINGLEDKPAFQLRYDPRIAAIDSTPFPVGIFVNVSGIRTATAITLQIGSARLDAPAYDGIALTNPDPMFIGGGGDNHFVGEVCALVLEVGDQSASEARSNAFGAFVP